MPLIVRGRTLHPGTLRWSRRTDQAVPCLARRSTWM